jgi:hypothetical protein
VGLGCGENIMPNFYGESLVKERLASDILGYIQNIPDWCRHIYSSYGSAKHRSMVGLPCLVSQCARLHVAGWTWTVFTSVYLVSFMILQRQSGIFWIGHRIRGHRITHHNSNRKNAASTGCKMCRYIDPT